MSDFNIGPIGAIAPSPGPGPGRVVGLRSAANALGRVPEAGEMFGAMRDLAGKDFNDGAVGQILGADNGALAISDVPF